MSKETLSFVTPPPKNYKISSAFSYNFKLALTVLHMLQRILKRAGLERIRFHDLRHTFSVLALQNGVDVKTLSAMLGHYSAGFTLDTYAHVTTSMQKQAANAVGNFLSGALR